MIGVGVGKEGKIPRPVRIEPEFRTGEAGVVPFGAQDDGWKTGHGASGYASLAPGVTVQFIDDAMPGNRDDFLVRNQLTFTSTCLGCFASFLPSRTWSSPSLYSAVTFEESASSGSEKERWKLP